MVASNHAAVDVGMNDEPWFVYTAAIRHWGLVVIAGKQFLIGRLPAKRHFFTNCNFCSGGAASAGSRKCRHNGLPQIWAMVALEERGEVLCLLYLFRNVLM